MRRASTYKKSLLCQLEGVGHKNNQTCFTFVNYMYIGGIVQAQREVLLSRLVKAKFFSIQADSSTDSSNIEDTFSGRVFQSPQGSSK